MAEPRRIAAAGVLALELVALATWSWGRWTDPVIDFGFELYVPWRLVEGDVLYADIAYRNGPLSPWWNALLFRAFGVSLRTLALANLAVLAAICTLLFVLIERACSRWGALAGVAVVLATCGFSQYGTVGNYNFVTPYQHGQTHGLLLGLALVAILVRAARPAHWAAAGALLGTLALTKAEVFVPGLAAATAAVVLEPGSSRGGRTRAFASLAAACAVPPCIAWALLRTSLSPDAALRALLGNWPYLGEALLSDRFYAAGAGLDRPGHHLLAMGIALGTLAGAGIALAACERAARGRPAPGTSIQVAIFASVAALGAWVDAPWPDLARALPVGLAVALAVWLPRAWRGDPHARAGTLLGIYALALLGKLGLHPRIEQYGFALAAPALALAVAAAVAHWRTAIARAAALGLAAAFAVALLGDAQRIYGNKTFWLANGADAIRVASPETSPRGPVLERVLRGLDAVMPADATLLVMPEGAGLDYWLRRRNPTPYALFLPTEQAAHGGAEAMLERMRATPPDFVALVHRGHAEFGTGPFLDDPRYGAAFRSWLERDYELVQVVGDEPFRGAGFGVAILRRTDRRSAVSQPR
jgi:hypothetical protein